MHNGKVLQKAKSSPDFAKNTVCNGCDEDILSFKLVVTGKAGSIENGRPEFTKPVHNGSIKYQETRSKTVLENVKLNNVGKIGMYMVQCKNAADNLALTTVYS